MLVARDVSRSYGERKALENVSLRVEGGEVVALLGPNGAGKSTLLQILAGVLAPDGGTVTVDGETLPGAERRVGRLVGFVPQGDSLYPELAVRECVSLFGSLHGVHGRKLKERVASALAEVGLTERANSRVGTLSGGLRQRAAIAASLVHDPKVLLLDEPGSGLDPLARQRLADVLRAARAGGRAVLVSTHHVEEAARGSDRVLFLAGGKIRHESRGGDAASLHALFSRAEANA